MTKFKLKNEDCYLDYEDIDDLTESTRYEAKQRKNKKKEHRESDFFSNYKNVGKTRQYEPKN